MDKLIEQIAKAPTGIKLAVVCGAIVALTAIDYFVVSIAGPPISAIETRITKADADQKRLQGDIAYKTGIANDLNRFRRNRQLLDQRLKDALAELPDQKRIDEILQQFEDRAQKAGLTIVSLEPKEQQVQGFYARIPINMEVSGNFHEIATFFDALAHLRRIVNVSEISFGAPQEKAGKVTIGGKFVATTFMFVDPKTAAEAAKGKKGKVTK